MSSKDGSGEKESELTLPSLLQSDSCDPARRSAGKKRSGLCGTARLRLE